MGSLVIGKTLLSSLVMAVEEPCYILDLWFQSYVNQLNELNKSWRDSCDTIPPTSSHSSTKKESKSIRATTSRSTVISSSKRTCKEYKVYIFKGNNICRMCGGQNTWREGARCWSPEETRLRLPERGATGPCRSGLGGAGHQTPCAYAIVDQCPTDQSNDPFSPHPHPQLRTTIPQENIFQYFRNGKYLKDFTCWACILNIPLTNTWKLSMSCRLRSCSSMPPWLSDYDSTGNEYLQTWCKKIQGVLLETHLQKSCVQLRNPLAMESHPVTPWTHLSILLQKSRVQ